ncbi:T9SS type A sorting domain-containing protein [Formosa sp. 3Alg 14/1]|uniref:T9SS type A sorting domain-containing protein n=1 Tax=unclassified Formosa TaxID=2644710 RepID=UPI0039BE52F2
MIKKLLFLFALLLCPILNAQTDEASTNSKVLLPSATYNCENEVTGDFFGFTKSPEFTCTEPGYDSWTDAWYTFTPTKTGKYSVEIESLNTSDNYVRVNIFTGIPGALTSQTGCSTRYYSNTFNSGQTYYINVRGADPSIKYRLCAYEFPDAPSNDEPSNADVLLESTFDVCQNPAVGYTTEASHSSESICSPTNADVWYTFTPGESGEYTFKTSLINGSARTYISIYDGTPGYLNAFPETVTSPTIQCEDVLLADLTAGKTYYISVTALDSSQAIYFELCAYLSPDAPSNDECTTPLPLTVGKTFEDNEIIATTTSASVNAENSNFPNCGTLDDFGIYGKDVWFSVVVPESGNFTIETRLDPTETHLSDTAMEGYTGSCGVESLIPLYYNEPAPNTGMAHCNNQFVVGLNPWAGISYTDLTPGDVVLVRVWGWSYQFGKFRISAYDESTLSNETFDLDGLKYYPNPTTNVVNISYKKNIDKVVVNNLMGKTVLTEKSNSTSVALDTSNLATGIYVVTVHSNNTITHFKIVKE